jgi:hypothetical protein
MSELQTGSTQGGYEHPTVELAWAREQGILSPLSTERPVDERRNSANSVRACQMALGNSVTRLGNFELPLGVAIGQKKECGMRTFLIAALFAIVPGIGPASAADGCGPGCHSTPGGACVVDGWGTGARTWNECPAGAQPRPPCGYGYVWRRGKRACFAAD